MVDRSLRAVIRQVLPQGRIPSGNLDFAHRLQVHSSEMQFYQLAPGARFEFRGRHFKKVAISMAQDSERNGNIFQGETEITPIGEPLLLPEAEAAKWKPSEIPWNSYLTPSPCHS